MRKCFGRPTPATVISLLALFVALGGTGYAAVKINGKNIKNGTITGKKLKGNTLTGRQVNENRLAKVKAAAAADTAVAATNAANASNAAALGGTPAAQFLRPGQPVPAGATVTGGWNCQEADNDTDVGQDPAPSANSCRTVVSLPVPAAAPLTNDDVVSTSTAFEGINYTDADFGCNGTFEAPTAPAGKVCLYPAYKVGVVGTWDLAGNQINPGGNRHGFIVELSTIGENTNIGAGGTWAYTAP